ncbi:MAG TPA: cytochrome P450 [Pyrinomonadaceae bacterium]
MLTPVQTGRDWAAFYLNLSRTGGDVVAYRLAGRPAFLVNSPAHAARVLEERGSNYVSPAHPYRELAGLYTSEGASLMRLERAGAEGFAAHETAARMLAEAGERAAVSFCDLSEDGPVNVEVETKKLMFAVVARLLFGVDASHLAGEFVSAVSFAEECWAQGLYQTPSAEPDASEQRFRDSLARQDAAAAWIAREAGAGLADGNVPPQTRGAVSRTLLNGYHATAATLCWTLYLLARHPATLAALQAELDRSDAPGPPRLLRAVLMESLRLYPPAWILTREAVVDDRLGETEIPAGSSVSVSPYAMHRLSTLWERAEEFLPGRFLKGRPSEPFAYLPFGAGARRCPASNVAVKHLHVLLAALLRRCRVEPADDEPIRPRGLISLRPEPCIRLNFKRRL